MLRKIHRFITLSHVEKRLFLEAYIMLGIMRVLILSISFKRLTRALEYQKSKDETMYLSDDEMQIACLVGKAIERAAAYTPWESACLVQSLTVQKMLKKRGIPGVFYLGVTKDHHAEEKMRAHAWSQCGDVILTGAQGQEAFTVIATFKWGKA